MLLFFLLAGVALAFVALLFRSAFVSKSKHASFDAGVSKAFASLFFVCVAVVVLIVVYFLAAG